MPRSAIILTIAGALSLCAQRPSYWRQNLGNLPENPPSSTSIEDVARFERSMQSAAPYFARITPNDYEGNRALARRMAVYLAGLQVIARDPQMRLEVGRAQRIFNSLALSPLLGYGYPLLVPPAAGTGDPIPGDHAAPVAPPAQPPFAMSAPIVTGIAPADKSLAQELSNRYEADAGRAAGAWQNAETLRLSLASRGMSLNNAASASLIRLPTYFSNAADSLRRRDWDEARTDLVRAESETEKIMKSVGR